MPQDPEIVTLHGKITSTKSGRYTAYFLEFPNVFAEGDTPEEVKTNLVNTLKAVLEIKRKESQNEEVLPGSNTTNFNLKFSAVA